MEREFRKWALKKLNKVGFKNGEEQPIYEYELRPVQRVKFIKKAIEILTKNK